MDSEVLMQRGQRAACLHAMHPCASQGGQAQRVVIAVAVALKPPILLLDEPTSALDPESAKLAEAVLKACGSACVWVSHDPAQPGRVGGRVLDLPAGQMTFASC